MDEAPPAGGRKIVIGTPFSAIPMEFWIYDNTTVAQLKEKIHSAKGIPTERQELMIRKGTRIEGMADNKEGCTMTLQGQDVIPRDVNEAVLHVHLQGGCGVGNVHYPMCKNMQMYVPKSNPPFF